MTDNFNWNLEELTSTQKNIADFIEKNTERLPFLTENDIALEVNTSIASVSRFWKAIGYSNLKEFKKKYQELKNANPVKKLKNMIDKFSVNDPMVKFMELGAEYLRDTSFNLRREMFDRAVEVMVNSDKVHVFAPGPSEGLGYLLQFRLNRFGVNSESLTKYGHALFESLVNLKETDSVVIFGFFNLVPEIKVILEYAAELNFTTIVITDRIVSELNNQVDILLYACRGELWEFHSMLAPTAIVESLVIAVGLKLENRSLNHLEKLQELRAKYARFIPK